MRSLLLIGDAGSITEAARQQHLSPAAIFKHLKVLETELGVTLYERTGRRLRLTQAGEVLLPHFRHVLSHYESSLLAIQEWKGLKTGVVRIGAGPTISSYILPGIMKRFRRRFPGIDLLVETGSTRLLLDGLSKGALDLAFLISSGLPEEPNVSVEGSWDLEIVFVSNLASVPRRCAIRELKNIPFILFREGSRIERLIDRYFAQVGFQPRVSMRFDNAEAIKAMIETGLGISMLPYYVVDQDLRRGLLFLVRQKEPTLVAKIAMVARRSSYTPAPVAAFIKNARSFQCRKPRLLARFRRRSVDS